MTAIAPERSYLQRLDALANANVIRTHRARMKRDLRVGRLAVVPLVASPPEWIETMKLYDLLVAAPSWGRVKANKFLTRAKISPSKTVGGLSDRQRRLLIDMLDAA